MKINLSGIAGVRVYGKILLLLVVLRSQIISRLLCKGCKEPYKRKWRRDYL
jgi:hypothetical protein